VTRLDGPRSGPPEESSRRCSHDRNALVVAGLGYGASRLGINQTWIVVGALVIIGLGLMGGIVKTRQKDPAA
jgi:hypothetical protein